MADNVTIYAALALQEMSARARFAEENVQTLAQAIAEKDREIAALKEKVAGLEKELAEERMAPKAS